jgi:glycosyltransferase involved in cell wall biosynthesis
MSMKRLSILVCGPDLAAVSGVSTHLGLLLSSGLAEKFTLTHFQVGREGRNESRLSRIARFLFSPLSLALAILGRGVDVVHLNTSLNPRAYWRDLVYLLVAKACGARVLYQVHGGDLPQQFFRGSRLLTAWLRATLRIPDAVVVLANSEVEAYRAFVPAQQVMALPNGIDIVPFARLARSDHRGPLRLVYIGRLAREKGLYEALAAMQLSQADKLQVRLVIAGSGPEEASLKRCAADLGIAGNVSFTGPVFGEDKINLLGDADAFLLPTYAEGLPYALLESMAAGVPVVATRVGAIPDVVTEGVHGLFVPCRDAPAIAAAIARLYADRASLARMSEACRRRVAERYSISRLSQDFATLYSQMCSVRRIGAASRP